jgi:Chaperone of endosialidase
MNKSLFILILLITSIRIYAQTGIGTTTPVNKFQVESSTADPLTSGNNVRNGHLRLSGLGVTHLVDVGLMSTTNHFGTWIQARKKDDYSVNYTLLLNPNGGAVGVGTNSPTTTLTVGNSGGTIAGELTLNPAATSNEGGQITLKKSLNGSTADWTIDQYGTTSADARIRIFAGTTQTNGLTILENGNVGIGVMTPTTKLYVNGDITANSIAGTSDVRFKTNIRSVSSALDKIKQLRGVYFNWNQKAFPEKDFGAQDELGFIAQEVEKIVPEIVIKDKTKDEYRSVKYDKLVALLVEAIKEQQKQIDDLNEKVNKLSKSKNK